MTGRAMRLTRPWTGARLRIGRLGQRPGMLAAGGVVALLVVMTLAVAAGSVSIEPATTVAVILRAIGLPITETWAPSTAVIVMDLRLPRVLTAAVVGGGLAVAGATFQGLLRNPLADPYVLGSASGAALGAAIAVLIPVQLVILQLGLLNLLAFAGALGATTAVVAIGHARGMGSMTTLLLTGYAISSLLAAGLAMAMYASGTELRQIFDFLLGGLSGSTWTRLAIAAPLVIGATVAIQWRAGALDGMLLGEEAAVHLGVNVGRERTVLLGLGSLATAAAVSISGLIGFVGLVAAHAVRLVVGPEARRVIPLSALFGAILLVVADLIARLLGEIPVGVVTALIGAPIFVWLLVRSRSAYEV